MRTGQSIAAALLFGLTACTVIVDEPGPRPGVYPPRPGPQPQFCTREYRPVCGERFGERQTFPNECVAQTRGFRIINDGECRRISPPQLHSEPLPPHRPDGGAVVCAQIYAPVCARQGRILRTFSNECVADASGFDVVDDGPC